MHGINVLQALSTQGGLTTSYGYDALGQRISKSPGAGTASQMTQPASKPAFPPDFRR